ncbi:MAG: diguanylate cyclase [Frankiales bacterium]|nr:diguanylate cyclase [Frankiales bacterium]
MLLGATLLAALGLTTSQHDTRQGLVERFDARTGLSADFVGTYVDQLFTRESQVATADLTAPRPDLSTVSTAFGFSNAVLLDERGAVLAVFPAKPALIGKVIAPKYPHLTSAVAGARAVSPVVPAAADGAPVVGFALPFSTASGRRVFSGAYDVRHTPLTSYLQKLSTLKGAGFYLVDGQGTIVTSSSTVGGVRTLGDLEPALARAVAGGRSGSFGAGQGEQRFAVRPVPGTPWRVVARTPSSSLFMSVNGPGRYVSWVLLGILAVVASVALWLWFRRLDDHADLRVAYARLDRQASLDVLTELLNRRATQTRLLEEHARARRTGSWLSVLMIDVDHFKRINDTFGHSAGDVALVAVADRLRIALRDEDVIGRWGGEEFLVLLPATDPETALVVAERLRAAVATTPVGLGTGGDAIHVSISVGSASSLDAVPDVLVHAADRALYAAKAAGRDQVHAIVP